MFVGELSVFLAYGGKKWLASRKAQTSPEGKAPMSPGAEKADQKKLKTNLNPLLLAIPAAFDFTASTLMFIALTMTPASVY